MSICSSGWSDVKRQPFITIMASSSDGQIFLNSIYSIVIVKDGEYVANLFLKATEAVEKHVSIFGKINSIYKLKMDSRVDRSIAI